MKTIILILILLVPSVSFAKTGGGGVHFKENPPYDCSVTEKPSAPKWVVKAKKDKLGDKRVVLTWDDSKRAHDVEIQYWYSGGKVKTKKTGDDSREKIKKLKNGKVYNFKIRGYSNCGKGKWSKTYSVMP
jgi:hypothetical protein